MTTITDRLEHDLVTAIKSGDFLTRDTLRMLKTALKNKEIEKMAAINEEDMIFVLRKEMKIRTEASDQYARAGRHAQAEKENTEKQIIKRYLPAEISDSEINKIIEETLISLGAASVDMGKVMSQVIPKLKGQANSGKVAQIVKQHLDKTGNRKH